jgi:carbamoyltransferase
VFRQVAELIARGEVVAWFQGRMEWGPRALGNRSILADPRRAEIKQMINREIKHREFFRPFAASILTERAPDWFDIGHEAFSDRFMLYARKVRPDKLGRIPAVTHVDDTCRIQRVDAETNLQFHQLLREFERLTGVPMVLNTSLNDREPLICSPEDAFKTCRKAGIRYLVLGDRIIDLAENTEGSPQPVLAGVADEDGTGFLCATAAESASLAFRSR